MWRCSGLIFAAACFPAEDVSLPAIPRVGTLLLVLELPDGSATANAYDLAAEARIALGARSDVRAWALYYEESPATLELPPGPIPLADEGRPPAAPKSAWTREPNSASWVATSDVPRVTIAAYAYARCQTDRMCGETCEGSCSFGGDPEHPIAPALPDVPPEWPVRLDCPPGQAHFLEGQRCEAVGRACTGEFPPVGQPIATAAELVSAIGGAAGPLVLGLKATTYELQDALLNAGDLTIIGCGASTVIRFDRIEPSGLINSGNLRLENLRIESRGLGIGSDGGTVELEDVSVQPGAAAGIYLSGGLHSLSRTSIENGAIGMSVDRGATVSLSDVSVRGAVSDGIVCVSNEPTRITAGRLVLHDPGELYGIFIEDRCSLEAEDLFIDGSRGTGIFVLGGSVTATRTLTRNVTGGVAAFKASHIHLHRAFVSSASDQAIAINSSPFTASDITIDGARVGLTIIQSDEENAPMTTALASRLRIVGTSDMGLWLDGEGETLLRGVEVSDVTIEPSHGSIGIEIGDVELVIERAEVDGGDTGVGINGPENAVLRDITIRGASEQGLLMVQEDGFDVELSTVRISDVRRTGLRVQRNLPTTSTVSAVIEGLTIEMADPGAYGLLVEERADIALSHFVIRGLGVGIGANNHPKLQKGSVVGCEVGAQIADGLAVLPFLEDVLYVENVDVIQRRATVP